MPQPLKLKQLALYCLVGSVAVAATLGMFLVLRGKWGWFELRVMITTITLGVASVFALACDLARARNSANVLPSSGIVVTVLAACLILGGVWFDVDAEAYWKTTAVLSIFAAAITHICLLSIARLVARFRWILAVAYQVIFGLAILLAIIVIWEIEGDRVFRFIAAISILDAALTLVIPILHRISRLELQALAESEKPAEQQLLEIDAQIAQLKRQLQELQQRRERISGEQQRSTTN